MPEPLQDFLGYLRYEGSLVEAGIIDARSAARALSGFDLALRYCIAQENPEFATNPLPIPVFTERGSWTVFVPHDVVSWVETIVGAGATIYSTTAAKKLAETDFKDVGLTTIFRNSLSALQWCIRIGKHLGDFTKRSVDAAVWRNGNSEVGIRNALGQLLFVPKKFLDVFLKAPRTLLKEVAIVVETERILKIGRKDGAQIEEVTISSLERHIFVLEEDPEAEMLFPELVHGEHSILDGLVTKGNEKENSIGFEHNHHVLTCYPRVGSMVRFKPHLFLLCRIYGTIDRSDGHGGVVAGRPKIIFDDLQILKSGEPELF